MSKKVADFLKALATKAGANIEDETLKTALSNLPPDLELPDELATPIDNGLLSLSAAKNNHPDIKKHYFGQAYKGLDAELDAFLELEKLPDEIVSEIKKESSSTRRAIIVAQKIKELEGKKASASKGDKEQYVQQIAELNNQLREIKEKEQGIHAEYKKQIQDVKMNHVLGSILSGYKTRFDDLDNATKETVLKNIITKNLGAKQATFALDEQGNLKLVGNDGSNVFGEDHTPLTPKKFLDKVMADEKIIVVNDTGNTGTTGSNNGQYSNNGSQGQYNGQQRQNFQNQNSGNGNNGKKGNPALQALLNESQQDLEKSTSNGVL